MSRPDDRCSATTEDGTPCPNPSRPGSSYCPVHADQAVQQTRQTSLFVQRWGYAALLSIIVVGFLISWAAGCGPAFVESLVY